MSSRRRVHHHRGGFHPPHCPNPDCRFHACRDGWHFVRDGFYLRPSDQRRFQAFQCRHCGRNFSSRSFSCSYWLRRRDLLQPVAAWISEGPALRQIARVLGASHTTIARLVARLGRHCLLFHRNLMAQARLTEALVIDGFESFEYSQYFPFHANLATGAKSCFLYAFNDAPLRRKGSMTLWQKQRRAQLETRLGRPDPKAIETAMAALVREALALLPAGETLKLHSDDHPAYVRAIRRVRHDPGCPPIAHEATSSTQRRTPANPLFPVNLADLRLRHGQANHRRETIAFSKRRQAAMERVALFAVWANCVKRKSEKAGEETSAMELGLLARPLRWSGILKRRLFPKQVQLCREWREYYERRVKTAVFGSRQAVHACRYAF